MRVFARGVKLANVAAVMTPMRANIVGPPDVATRIKGLPLLPAIPLLHVLPWEAA
jgi:hypothetical protein